MLVPMGNRQALLDDSFSNPSNSNPKHRVRLPSSNWTWQRLIGIQMGAVARVPRARLREGSACRRSNFSARL